MFYGDKSGVRDSKFVIGSITGYVTKIGIGKRGVKDVKCAVSGMEEESLD